MQFSKNTSTGISKVFLIKIVLILIIVGAAITMVSKIDFPTPNQENEKIIPNEKLKIIK